MSTHTLRRRVALAAAALTVVAPLAATAVTATASATTAVPAGSIVYLKSNNIWIMRGDGSGARAVTKDGTAADPWRTPTESDTGFVAAARGGLIYRMTTKGRVLNTIDAPMLVDSAGEHLDGAVNEAAISPNGRTIAFSYSFYGCPPGLSCGVRQATGYVSATTGATLGATSFYGMPSWIGNTRTLQFGTTSTVELQDVTAPEFHWFYDGDYANPPDDLTDGEVSDDGKQLATVRGFGANMRILTYKVLGTVKRGDAVRTPSPVCVTNLSPNVGSPTWAPAGAALAYSYPAGIYVMPQPATCGAAGQPVLIAAGGTHPDWSAAELS